MSDNLAQQTAEDHGAESGSTLSFWDHLSVLRTHLLHIFLVVVVASVAAFCFKDALFRFVLAPAHSDFFVYRWLGAPDFHMDLINTELTEQMLIHMKVATYAGIVVASPYILYSIFAFVAPALYAHERRYAVRLVGAAYTMFFVGSAVCYLLIFPLTVRFLGTYQVSAEVSNYISLTSYVDGFVLLSLGLGLVFELPVLSFLLGRFGLLRASWMRRYRRHAVVAVLIVAAFITPTTDMFTLVVVSMPIYLLYECSILLVAKTQKHA